MEKNPATRQHRRPTTVLLIAGYLIVALAILAARNVRANNPPPQGVDSSLSLPLIVKVPAQLPSAEPTATSTPSGTLEPTATPDPASTWEPTATPGVVITPGPSGAPLPIKVIMNSQIPCDEHLSPAQYVNAPPLFSRDCAVSAGHSVKVELRYFGNGAALEQAFATLRGTSPLEDFHGAPAFYRQEPWTQAPGGTQQTFAWHSQTWLITLRTFDDTHFLGPIRQWAESLYQVAAIMGLEGHVPPFITPEPAGAPGN
jgi:hypothetical protein